MADIHLTRELLRAASRGKVAPRALTQIGLQHLMALCPHCRREIEAWQAEELDGGVEPGLTLQTLPALLARHAPEVEAGRRRAEQDLEALLKLPPEERQGKIRRARSRFRGTPLAELLLEESRKRLPGSPGEAYHLADLARLVLHHSLGTPGSLGLVALATAQMANARRAGGDLREAEEHFRFVRFLVSEHGVTDSQVLAQIDHLEGSLRKDQRRFARAEELLNRAVMLYQASGDAVGTSRVLLKLGSLYFNQGRLNQAIAAVSAALENLPSRSEPRLYLYGRHNLAVYLVEARRYEEALDILSTDEDLYRLAAEPWLQLHLSWLRGRIAAGLGDVATAERAFLETRDGFIRQGIGYDAAMVSLDLAILYLKEGRTGDVRRIAEEMVPLFTSQDVHREAVAALMLFQEAARREEATTALAREVASFLEAVRRDPSLRFR